MDTNEKIDEAIDYIRWLINNSDPDSFYSFVEHRNVLLSIIGELTLLKTK